MKHYYSFTTAFATAPEAPAHKAEQPVRGRNVKMDQFLRKVNGSPRYDATVIEANLTKAAKRGGTIG